MLEILLSNSKKVALKELSPAGSANLRAYVTGIYINSTNILTWGGWNGTSSSKNLNIYNPTTNRFVSETNITNINNNHSCATVANNTGNGILLLGGAAYNKTIVSVVTGQTTASIFNITNVDFLARQETCVAKIGTSAYIFGGWGQGDVMLNDTWHWDTNSHVLTKLNPPLSPNARRAATSCAHNNEFYILGGRPEISAGLLRDFWKYNPTSNTWTKLADLPVSTIVPSMTSHKGRIYVITGYVDSGSSGDLYRYDHVNNRWDRLGLTDLIAIAGHSLVSAGDSLLLMWGIINGTPTNRIFKLDGV